MLKFWTTGISGDAFVITSAVTRVDRSPGAVFITGRDGAPHRIAGESDPAPVRLAIEFPENLLALSNTQPVVFRDFLSACFSGGDAFALMESTEGRAYECFVEELDARIGARRDRLSEEDVFARVLLWINRYGSFTDWDNLASIEWEE